MNNGSPLWQTIFISFALLLILFEVVRGWRLGIVRQVVRLFAVVAAYTAALLGGRWLVPILRPVLRIPDLFISVAAGAILALAIYAAVNALGAILFKRTGQQAVGMVRLLYGVCGAALGIFFGFFIVWLVVVAIRSTGAIANAELHSQTAAQDRVAPLTARPASSPNETQPMLDTLARLKNSIELGSLGEAIKAVDVVPTANLPNARKGWDGGFKSAERRASPFLSRGEGIDGKSKDHRAAQRPRDHRTDPGTAFSGAAAKSQADRGAERPALAAQI